MKLLPLLIFSLVSALPAFAQQNVFVHSGGNDLTGDGSLSAPFATIQKAIDQATDGDTIIVGTGTFTGPGNRNIDLSGKKVLLKSTRGERDTIIDCENQEKFIFADSGETRDTVVDGFTVINGYAESSLDWDGSGIVYVGDGSTMTVRNCVFRNNTTKANYVTTTTAVIYKRNDRMTGIASTVVSNCLFYDNSIGGGGWTSVGGGRANVIGGSGVSPIPSVGATITDCTITGNTLHSSVSSSGGHTGGMRHAINGADVSNTIVWQNTGHYDPRSTGRWLDASVGAYSASYNLCDGIIEVDTSNNQNTDPMFVDATADNFALRVNSPALDAGSPASDLDADGTRNDIGYTYRHPGLVKTNIALAADDLKLNWVSQAGHHYKIIKSTDLITWSDLPSFRNLSGTGQVVTTLLDFDSGATFGAECFFRVVRTD